MAEDARIITVRHQQDEALAAERADAAAREQSAKDRASAEALARSQADQARMQSEQARMEADFTREQRKSFTITRDILWESETAANREVFDMEMRMILEYRSNDPDIGYNLRPKHRPLAVPTGKTNE